MAPFAQTISHADARDVMQGAGYAAEVIEEVMAQLPDPIDLDRDGPVLERYGLTLDQLSDRMGASP